MSATLSVSATVMTHDAGVTVANHAHDWGQLGFVTHGTMMIVADEGWWLAPPGRAVWVPPGTRHSASYSESSALINVHIAPPLADELPARCTALTVSGLLRELALEAVRFSESEHDVADVELVSQLIIRQLQRPATGPALFIPQGQDRRLRIVTNLLQQDPGTDHALADLATLANTSSRTLARLFVAETGLSFGRWRDHLRVITAVDRLARGQAVTRVALELGYQSPGSFSTMFSRLLGISPSRYMKTLRD